jgi:hypothetical protein
MLDPAMIQWNPNPEMFPNQPVGLPNYSMPTARIAIDPIRAFNQQPPVNTPPPVPPIASDPQSAFGPPQVTSTGSNWQVPTPEMQPFSRAIPEPQRTFAPSYGPMQDLALQMAGYGAPSGYREQTQMSVTPYSPSPTGGGGYDGADPNRPGTTPPAIQPPSQVADPGMGGGGIPNSNTWINDLDAYLNWASGNGSNPFLPNAPGSNPFSGVDWGNVLGTVGTGINAAVNPLGAIVNAITSQDDETEEPQSSAQEPASQGSTATGGSPSMPWLGNEGPTVNNDANNQPIGNISNEALDRIIQQIIPRFSPFLGTQGR